MERPKLRLSDMNIPRAHLPTVDIMIPCFNEPVEVKDIYLVIYIFILFYLFYILYIYITSICFSEPVQVSDLFLCESHIYLCDVILCCHEGRGRHPSIIIILLI